MTTPVPAAPLPSSDPAFDLLVDGLIARLQAGEALDWQAVTRDHPQHAGRLRSLSVALDALGDLSTSGESALSGLASGSAEEAPVPGVLGDFRIVRELGRGGMGVVYEAEQLSLDRRVALKVLPLAATLDPQQLARFRHEARAAGLLHHPHIVPVYGVGCERGVHYYAMQLIEGCSLATVIARHGPGEAAGPDPVAGARSETRPLAALDTAPTHQGPRSFRRVAELIAQVAGALEYAHTMGVVHRDVKPANLLLDAGGNVWVTDFGVARLGEGAGLTVSGDLLGTLLYMSPEQALAKHGLVDHRTDIYSLGATLYELLTLRPAVDGASKHEVLHRLAFEEPVAPRKLDRSIPAELETITLKAMARPPEERYATARELADDLRRWLEDRPILARPPGPGQRLRKWSHRHRPLVAALAVFLTLLVARLCLGAVAYGVRKGELADDRSRFARRNEQSEQKVAGELRQVLLQRAEAVRLARRPGYRRSVWADLRRAMALPASGADADQVRGTVLDCLADPLGLDPVADPTAVPRARRPRRPAGFERRAPESARRPAAVSPDEDLVAVAGPSGGVTLYSREGKRLRQEWPSLSGIYGLALAAGGKVLAAGCEQGFVVWELPGPASAQAGAQGRAMSWAVRAGNVFSLGLSPNGRLLATSGRQVELWSLATKRLLASWPAPAGGARLEFSADGRTLLAVANGAAVAGWPVRDTPERRVLDRHAGGVPALAFSPDGRLLVSVSKDRSVRLWESAGGRCLRTLTGHAGEVEAVAFSPDGALLATGDFAGSVRIWDVQSGALLGSAGKGGLPGQVWRLQFAPGGEYLAAAGAAGAIAWVVRAAPRVSCTCGTPARVALEPLCQFPVSGGRADVIDLAIRPGGTEVVFLTRSGELSTCDLAAADGARLAGHARAALRSLHFTAAGDRFTFVTPGGTLGVWDWKTKAARDTRRRAESVAVSADGRWAAVVGAGQGVTLAELASGREVLALPPEGGDVWGLAWAPDGTKLAAGLSDGAVAVWDLGQARARLAEFGIDSPSTARHKAARGRLQRTHGFDRVVRVNRWSAEGQEAIRRATAARVAGDRAAERDHLLAALKQYERLAEAAPAAAGHRRRLAEIHQALAKLEDNAAALRRLEVAAGLLERLAAGDPGNPEHRRALACCLTERSRARGRAGQRREAVADARRVTAEWQRLAAEPGAFRDRVEVGIAYHNLAFQLGLGGRLAEAERWYRAALAVGDREAAATPGLARNPRFRLDRGNTLDNLGIFRVRAGDRATAGKLFDEAAAIRTRLADDFPANAAYASDAGRTLDWQGAALRDRGRLDESALAFREAGRRHRAALALRPTDPVIRGLCCTNQALLAGVLLRLARHAEAAAAAREVARLAPDDPARLLTAARLLARCVALAERATDQSPNARSALARAYRHEAIGLARRAAAKGGRDPNLDGARGRDEFPRLLERAAPGKKP
jgi:serine/threonine protein kinase/WD40 repeat protein/tetratricopeptide (TPR) repeat protein